MQTRKQRYWSFFYFISTFFHSKNTVLNIILHTYCKLTILHVKCSQYVYVFHKLLTNGDRKFIYFVIHGEV